MTTSGVYTLSFTARDMAYKALRDGQIIAAGTDPTAVEVQDVIDELNLLLKEWETRGYTLWRQETAEVDITANVNPTTLASDVYDVAAVRFQTTATLERPLTPFDRDQYKILPNKTQTGNPSIFYIDRQRDQVDLYVWPVPSANSKVNIDYLRKIEVVTDATQTLDIPQDWQGGVLTILTKRVCTAFGYPVPDEIAARAAVLEFEIDAQDRPSSYFMGPYN